MSYYYGYYKPSRPRAVKGGIKAQSRRGQFGKSWWAKRWIDVLEAFDLGGRLDRGRSYARGGQVMSVKVSRGMVTARVQGSSRTPYDVQIKVKTLSQNDWQKVADALFAQPVLAARLLTGSMPENIESVFEGVGLSLFPGTGRDMHTDCDCPDWSNPCKHIAAVYYLLGEEFDRDPFLIFTLRGAEREALLAMAGLRPISDVAQQQQQQPSGRPPARDAPPLQSMPLSALLSSSSPLRQSGPRTAAGRRGKTRSGAAPITTAPLPADPDEFWGRAITDDDNDKNNNNDPAGGPGATSPPQSPQRPPASVGVPPTIRAALPKRLGSFPFWRSEEAFIPAMEGVYGSVSAAGLDVLLAGMQDRPGPGLDDADEGDNNNNNGVGSAAKKAGRIRKKKKGQS